MVKQIDEKLRLLMEQGREAVQAAKCVPNEIRTTWENLGAMFECPGFTEAIKHAESDTDRVNLATKLLGIKVYPMGLGWVRMYQGKEE